MEEAKNNWMEHGGDIFMVINPIWVCFISLKLPKFYVHKCMLQLGKCNSQFELISC